MSRGRLYLLLLVACTAGYSWLAVAYRLKTGNAGQEYGVCLIKHTTGVPCPSCGSTRFLLALLQGDLVAALHWNPLGLLLLLIMLVAPLWILYDVVLGRETLFLSYKRTEHLLKRKWIAIPALLMVLGNWIWNIYKGL